MLKKQYCEAPEAEELLVTFEKNILSFDDQNHTETLTHDDYHQLP